MRDDKPIEELIKEAKRKLLVLRIVCALLVVGSVAWVIYIHLILTAMLR